MIVWMSWRIWHEFYEAIRKHGYPPDKQEKATQTVLQQAELLCADCVS